MITTRDTLEVLCKEGMENYTCYFYKKLNSRKFQVNDHHRKIFEVLDRVIMGELKKVIIAMPPRYGKTEVAVKAFMGYGLAVNASAKFIHLSYSDDLALDNSDAVRETVGSEHYREVFPYVKIKPGSDSKKKWYTTSGGGVYATAAGGQVTGFGAGQVDKTAAELEEERIARAKQENADLDEFMIDPKEGFAGALVIDDSMKPEDADNEAAREKVNKRWDSTISNRVNSRNTPIIYIGHRLHEKDLPGHLIELDGLLSESNPNGWFVLSLPAIVDYGLVPERPLWPEKHTLAELKKIEDNTPIDFERQYMQNPQPIKGRLYQKGFRTYRELPPGLTVKRNVIDTADEGDDFLCSICYMPTPAAYYVTDVYYTSDGMETTEEQTALQLVRENVDESRIESNNGGRSFARNVERIVREKYQNRKVSFVWFHQTQNKQARIFTNSAEVQNMLVMPEGWETKWPKFYKALTGHMAEGKNKHDDAADAATMVVEAEANLYEVAVG